MFLCTAPAVWVSMPPRAVYFCFSSLFKVSTSLRIDGLTTELVKREALSQNVSAKCKHNSTAKDNSKDKTTTSNTYDLLEIVFKQSISRLCLFSFTRLVLTP